MWGDLLNAYPQDLCSAEWIGWFWEGDSSIPEEVIQVRLDHNLCVGSHRSHWLILSSTIVFTVGKVSQTLKMATDPRRCNEEAGSFREMVGHLHRVRIVTTLRST